MITNNDLTLYHKALNKSTRLEEWKRYNYDDVWIFETKGSIVNKGYENNNNVEIRIPYRTHDNLNIANFSVGDILVIGKVKKAIQTQQDLSGYSVYNITTINNNTFGNEKHIHIGGR